MKPEELPDLLRAIASYDAVGDTQTRLALQLLTLTPQSQRQATDRGLADQLQHLKRALDQGFITRAEYERKRTDLVERY